MKIQNTIDITVPKGTVNISDTATNPNWVTLARMHKDGSLDLFSCPVIDLEKHDILDDRTWLRLTASEFNKIRGK